MFSPKRAVFFYKNTNRAQYKKILNDTCSTSTRIKNLSFSVNSKSSSNQMFNVFFNPQRRLLFIKRKFGLFKSYSIENKAIKNQLVALSNYIKCRAPRRRPRIFIKKPRIIFFKKINKLFFRAGRRLFIEKFGKKKTYTQSYLSTRIVNVIKND